MIQTEGGVFGGGTKRFSGLLNKKGIPIYYETNILSLTCSSLPEIEAEVVVVTSGKS